MVRFKPSSGGTRIGQSWRLIEMLIDRLDKTMLIQSRGTAKDSVGAITPTWTNRLSGVACAVWPASAKTVNDYARRDITAQYEMATATDVSASANDRVVVDGRTHVVVGYERFENATLSTPALYLVITGLRNSG